MSLVVWLPLNGDSHNQGLGKYIEKANTLAYTTNGKVTEKCMNSGKLVYDKNPLGKVGTICFWLYPKSAAEGNNGKSNIIFGVDPANTGGRKWSLYMFPDNKSLHTWGCQKDGSNIENGVFTLRNVLTESTWNHVCVTHDLQKEYVYVNGKLIYTKNWDSNGTFTFDVTTPIIWSSTTSNDINNFRMCDFRIYDTCLSKAEVMEIAKGKMLHYTFENPYAMETTNISHNIIVHDNHSGKVTLGSDSTGDYMNRTDMTLWSGIGIDVGSLLIKPGRYYTWSMEVMPIKDIEYVIDGNGECSNSSHASSNDIHFDIIRGYSHLNHKLDGSDTLPKGKLEAYKWTRIYFTVKVKQDCTNPRLFHTFVPYIPSGDTSVKVYYRNSQLEESMYDSPYTLFKRNPLTIKDNSGMGNNGTQIYQREEIPIISSPAPGNGSGVWGITITEDSGTYTITNFNSTDNQCVTLGKINYNSRYHYLNSLVSYEFDITLKNLVMANGKILSDADSSNNYPSMMQGMVHFTNGTSSWTNSVVSDCFIAKRLNDGKTSNGTFHIVHEKKITNQACLTNASYYDLGFRFNYVKSGTIIISNVHAYYGSLDTSKLTIADKSAVGSHSLYLNGKNYINCGVVTPSMMDELTASIWLYRDDWTVKPMLSTYSSFFGVRDVGGFAIGIDRNVTDLRFEAYYNSIGYLYPNDIDMTKLSTGWHLITGVADKNRIALYLDGELYSENIHNKNAQINMLFNNDSTIARMPIYVGAEVDGWRTTPTLRPVKDYYIDDVRLYATSLNDKDIKALYNVKTKVDNKSNLYCNQLIETKSENIASDLSEITECGQFRCTCSTNYDTNNRILTFTATNDSTEPYAGPYILNKYYGGRLITNKTYRYSIYVKFSKSGTWKVGDERIINDRLSPFYNGQKYEAGKWYKIENEGVATAAQSNFIFYYCSGLLETGDKIEIRDFKMYRLYDTDNYTQEITKKGQFKAFEVNELNVDDTNYRGATIIDRYNAKWLEVFYHRTTDSSGKVILFNNIDEAMLTNSEYKYSILKYLEEFRNKQGNFEFLLEYPDKFPNEYNRWIQTDNPFTVSEVISGNPYDAKGYKPIHIDWNSNMTDSSVHNTFSGILKSSSPHTLLDGSIGHGNWHTAIGAMKQWYEGIPGPTPGAVTGRLSLYVRIDDILNTDNFKIFIRNIKAGEVIEV